MLESQLFHMLTNIKLQNAGKKELQGHFTMLKEEVQPAMEKLTKSNFRGHQISKPREKS